MSVKKYIFLVKGIDGLSGGPRYVNNKCRYLKAHGWDVQVIWTYDVVNVQLEHVKPFDNPQHLFHELQFYPCWFTKRQKNKIIDRIIAVVGGGDYIVVESNKLQLGAWGELLAERLGAKHICFVTTERLKIKNKPTFEFYYSKLKRNEFFTIHEAAVNFLFSGFVEIEHPDHYFWSAMQEVDVEEYPFPVFDNMPKADYVITHFGRTKAYFNYMLDEIKRFVEQNQQKTINLFFLGEVGEQCDIEKAVDQCGNRVRVFSNSAVKVIPQQVFLKSDVIIATAGCAWVATNGGGKVISMDVNRNVPLGLMGYTTFDCNTRSGLYEKENNRSLSDWLQTLLVENKSFHKLNTPDFIHDFDYQMRYVTKPDGVYIDSNNVKEIITSHDKLLIAVNKLGSFKLLDRIYFAKKRKKYLKTEINSFNKKKSPVIVEFNGLAGLGKTTIADKLIENLNKLGYKTINRHYNNPLSRVLFHFFPKQMNHNLYSLVKAYADTLPIREGVQRKHLLFTNRYALKYQSIMRFSNADFAIIDEALIQFLVALAFQDEMPKTTKAEAIVRELKKMGIRFVRVDCINDVDLASERIMSRPSRGLAFEVMQKDELIKTLEIESANFDYMRELFSKVFEGQNVITIDTNRDPAENALKIQKELLSMSI